VIASAPGLSVTSGRIIMNGADTTNMIAPSLVTETLLSGGHTFMCFRPSGCILGTGVYALEAVLRLNNGLTVADKVERKVLENTES
jgi:hypothetical protein